MSRNSLFAYLRHLCALHLPPRLLLPHIIGALNELVGGHTATFWMLDESHKVCDVYSQLDQIYSRLPSYAEALHRALLTMDGSAPNMECLLRPRVERMAGLSLNPKPLCIDMYNEVLGTGNACHVLVIPLLEGSRCLGIVELLRLPSQRAFCTKERTLAVSTAEHLARALSRRCPAPRDLLPTHESGIIIVNSRNHIVFQDSTARRLLYFAASTATIVTRFGDTRLPSWLASITDQLWHAKDGRPCTATLRRESNWGTFNCRAHCLEDNTDSQHLIGIYLQRHEPTVLKLARSALDAGLSNAQRELVIHLASDKRYADIAAAMRIKETTVVDHTRKIYDRLNVGSRRELLRTLVHQPSRRA